MWLQGFSLQNSNFSKGNMCQTENLSPLEYFDLEKQKKKTVPVKSILVQNLAETQKFQI